MIAFLFLGGDSVSESFDFGGLNDELNEHFVDSNLKSVGVDSVNLEFVVFLGELSDKFLESRNFGRKHSDFFMSVRKFDESKFEFSISLGNCLNFFSSGSQQRVETLDFLTKKSHLVLPFFRRLLGLQSLQTPLFQLLALV